MQIWTEKHKPSQLDGIVGQKKAIEDVMKFMTSQPKGKAILLTGPTGCGKTLLVETLANQNDSQLAQINASDKRNAQEIDDFASTTHIHSLFGKGKIILLDEVDGISGQDRGAISSIINMIKASSFPIFLIANDPWAKKLRPLRPYVNTIKLHKVPIPSIAKRLRYISKAEGIDVEEDALKHLARWAQGDMRSAITDLQMVTVGRSELKTKDLESLGFRERESSIFEILPTIFKSRSLKASRQAIYNADKDSDEIFWWLENNMHTEFKNPVELAAASEILAKADMFRSLVMNQQNWRFKAYMVEMMAGISLAKAERQPGHNHEQVYGHGFTPYQPPRRFADIARNRKRMADMAVIGRKLGKLTHSSRRAVIRDYLPYLKIINKKHKGFLESLGLEKDEVKTIGNK